MCRHGCTRLAIYNASLGVTRLERSCIQGVLHDICGSALAELLLDGPIHW